MNKLNLFTLLLILSMSIGQINSAGINHANQRSPASVVYANGPAPDELKAGPSNRNISDHRKQNTKAVLQRYIVTTGAPTIETVYESSAMMPNLKSLASDEFIAEKLNSDDFNANHNDHNSAVKHNYPNAKVRFTNSHFERITDDESSKFQDSTTIFPEHQTAVSFSDDSSSTHIDTAKSSVNNPTSPIYSVYNDPVLRPGVHSTSFSKEDLNYNDKNNFNNDDSLDENHSRTESNNQNNPKFYGEKNSEGTFHSHHPDYFHHTTPSSSIPPGYSISTSIIESKAPPTPSADFKQTHHIINHQPISNNQTDSNAIFERFTHGDHINNQHQVHITPAPAPSALPIFNHHSTVFPVYHPQPTIQHIPVVTEIPVTEEQEHHGVIEKTFNVPQHGIQTKTYEIRRPAIQKQFYDIEEHVSVKPAGSVVIEIDQPISKIPTGHVNVKPDGNYGNYLPPNQSQPPPHEKEHNGQHHHDNNAQHHHGNGYLPPEPAQSIPHNSGEHTGHFEHGHNNYNGFLPAQPVAHKGDGHDKNFDHGQNIGYRGYLPPAPSQPVFHGEVGQGGQYDFPYHVHYAQPHGRIVYIDGQNSNSGTGSNDCNNQQFLYNLHQVNNVPHYSVPIGSAVTTTQTNGHLEDDSVVVNVKHSEKYVESLRKHTPNHTSSSPTLETLSRLQDSKPNPQQNQKYNSPQMVAKGEPDFSLPPYVEIKPQGKPFSAHPNVNKNFAANTLYTMHSLINNNLYNAENKEEAPENSQSLPSQQAYTNNVNTQNEKIIQQPVHIAHVQEISKTQFKNVQQAPKSNLELASIESLIIPNENVQSTKFQPKTTFIAFTEPSVSTTTLDQHNQEHKSTSKNTASPRLNFNGQPSLLTTPSNERFVPNSYSERSNVQNLQYNPQPSHIEVFNSETYKEEHKYQRIKNPTLPNSLYAQTPGITYQQTGTDQNVHSEKLQSSTYQPHANVVNSENIIRPISQKVVYSNPNGVTYSRGNDPNHNHAHISQNTHSSQNYVETSNSQSPEDTSSYTHDGIQPSQHAVYSQVPAITYHIRTDEISKVHTKNLQNSPQPDHTQIPSSNGFATRGNVQHIANYQVKNSDYPQVSISGSSSQYSNAKFSPTTVNSVNGPTTEFLTSDGNFATSTTSPNADFAQIYPTKLHATNTNTMATQSHLGRLQAANTFEKEDNIRHSQNALTQSSIYSQTPAASYHIRTDQLPHHSALIQGPQSVDFSNVYNGHIVSTYQLPNNIQIQPCQSDNPLLRTSAIQFPNAHATGATNDHADLKYPQLNSKYQEVRPPQGFQNSRTEPSASFTSESKSNQQEHLPPIPEHKQKLVTGYITPQNYQLPPQINNQPHNYYQQQSFGESNPQITGYSNQNKQINNASQQPSIQYFPPHNKFQTGESNFADQQTATGNEKNYRPEENHNSSHNNTNNSLVTVQKAHTGDNFGTVPMNSERSEQSQLPSLQIVVDTHENENEKLSNLTDGRREKKPKSERHRTHSAIQDSATIPTHSHLRIANNIHPLDSSISFHPLPSQSQSHILEYLLTNKGHSAQPVVSPQDSSSHHNYGLDSLKTRVVSATPASKFAKAAGEKINTRRIVINQPFETVQVVEEQEPITTYKQVTVQQPTVYKTQKIGVKKVETSVPVIISQPPIYSGIPVYHGSHDNSHIYLNHNHHIAPPIHDNYHVVSGQIDLRSSPGTEYSHAPITVH